MLARVRRLPLILGALALAASPTGAAAAQSPWLAPVTLAEGATARPPTPAVAIGRSGALAIAWQLPVSVGGRQAVEAARRARPGDRLGAAVEIDRFAGSAGAATVAVARDGTATVGWLRGPLPSAAAVPPAGPPGPLVPLPASGRRRRAGDRRGPGGDRRGRLGAARALLGSDDPRPPWWPSARPARRPSRRPSSSGRPRGRPSWPWPPTAARWRPGSAPRAPCGRRCAIGRAGGSRPSACRGPRRRAARAWRSAPRAARSSAGSRTRRWSPSAGRGAGGRRRRRGAARTPAAAQPGRRRDRPPGADRGRGLAAGPGAAGAAGRLARQPGAALARQPDRRPGPQRRRAGARHEPVRGRAGGLVAAPAVGGGDPRPRACPGAVRWGRSRPSPPAPARGSSRLWPSAPAAR